ncbi:MGH1-like glycoside hydrolase domain-containing protein [Palleronia sp. LCG004]|uniref:MGH1-like glycoside hydrolase domain-containing protein n=1 Tax=Palleronia sp. LCG004 TaxID=3079304 RepID=UPI0029428C07|nr:glucosidase [Palleronia sp. LCG004]WOI58043.1 glucosidase [Palleronia sp. LCG004]
MVGDPGPGAPIFDTAEGHRIQNADTDGWRRWGPYLAERQWGTVREDYSADGDAWSAFPHDHARSRAYRWGEDGIAGFCDEGQTWCLSLGLWNGADPIVKERLFGLTNAEGNHGEDVKELWWHLDAVPSHAWQRMLYRYPQRAFPYADLVAENARRRGTDAPEYKLEDTGILSDDRFFDVEVAYAKAGPDDVLMRVTVLNRGPQKARIHVLPQLVARNTWSWGGNSEKPTIAPDGPGSVLASQPGKTPLRLEALQDVRWLFCENETNKHRLYGIGPDGPFKDAINDHLVGGAVELPGSGTKCAALSEHEIEAGASVTLRYRLAPASADALDATAFDGILRDRAAEADAFYGALQQEMTEPDERLVQRRALAGLLWSKQVYRYDVKRWLEGDPAGPVPPAERRRGRNSDWTHLNNSEVILMPDTWEYPWYASWDLAFHAMAAACVDPAFAKDQLLLLTREWYMHPSGQLPAYEWSFSDANPPIHAYAALRVYRADAELTGRPDRAFLERIFHKLIVNFTWWVNRKDVSGRNLFQGGFLGLDNIGVFDRSAPVPGGGTLEQADATAWMAMYALNMMRMALELAEDNPAYEDIATKFFEHFLTIASAMTHLGRSEAEKDTGEEGDGLWNEADGFFYDVLVLPDGSTTTLRVRSLVGLIPLCAVEVLDRDLAQRHPAFARRLDWMLRHRPDLTDQVSRYAEPGQNDRLLLSLLRRHRMTAVLGRMLDETEFLSPHGVRSVSKAHGTGPFEIAIGDRSFSVGYEPGASQSGLFGGNSNWRGPVWMPLNFMLIDALREFARFYGDEIKVECPSGSGRNVDLGGVADELSRRLEALFLKDAEGLRPSTGGKAPRGGLDGEELLQFNEFFHGETGLGLGASHQTGWTALVALLLRRPARQSVK